MSGAIPVPSAQCTELAYTWLARSEWPPQWWKQLERIRSLPFPSFRLKGSLHARGLCASLYKYSGNPISTYSHHLHTLLMEAVCSANSSMLSAPLPKDVGTNGLVGHFMSNAWDANKEQLRRNTRKLESISPPTCRMNTTYFSHSLSGCLPWFIGTKGRACCNSFGWSSLECARGHRRTNTGNSLAKLFLCQLDAVCSQGIASN